MAEPTPFLVDLEERLSRDQDGSLRARLVEDLRAAESAFQAQLRRGGRNEDFQRWIAATHALAAAVDVLQTVRIPSQEPTTPGGLPSFSVKGA